MPPQSEKPIPEPGAIPGNPPSNGMPAENVQGPPEWGALDASVPPNFVSVEPVKLPAGTQLYRVFSAPSEADPYPAWEVGSWFARDPLPATESAWRGGYAIEESWNGGQYYVQWTVPGETFAWAGPAALQYGEYTNGEKAPGWHLPGGLTQVYIPPDKVAGGWMSKTTPWTPSAEPATPAKPPDVADQGYAGLAERLRQLEQVLHDMADEARRKHVHGIRLGLHAAGVARARERLERYRAAGCDAELRSAVHSLTHLARHVHTYYPWSARTTIATDLLRDIVVCADRLARTEKARAAAATSS